MHPVNKQKVGRLEVLSIRSTYRDQGMIKGLLLLTIISAHRVLQQNIGNKPFPLRLRHFLRTRKLCTLDQPIDVGHILER